MQKEIKPDSKDSDELEILSILIKEYENEHYPVSQPNPLEAIKFRLDQMNLSENELSRILGALNPHDTIGSEGKVLISSAGARLHRIPELFFFQRYLRNLFCQFRRSQLA